MKRWRLGALVVLMILAAVSPGESGDPQGSNPSAQTASECRCVQVPTRPTGGQAGNKRPPPPPPPPPPKCGEARSCEQKAVDEALLLEAEANKRAGRWADAAKAFLDVIKHAPDAATRQAAVDGYRDASDHALSTPKEDEARLLAAATEQRAGRWNAAAEKYLDALQKASDDKHRQLAREEYLKAADVIVSRWWRWSTYFAPLWWLHTHLSAFLLLAGVIALIVLLPLWARPGRALGAVVGRLPEILRPRFSGRARILATATLTDDAPARLFAAQLPHSAQEVRRRWKRVGVSFLSGSTTLLSVPTALANQIATEIPEIRGVNLGKLATLILLLSQYFSWRVESQVGFSPDSPTPPSPGRMRAYATLRWAWFTHGSYAVSPRALHAADFEKASYAIAARVLGAAQARRLI
jgi:hypothetical protein